MRGPTLRAPNSLHEKLLLVRFFNFTIFLLDHWSRLRRPTARRRLNIDPSDNEVVVCVQDRNDDACDQAIFVKVVAYLGDGISFVWSSSSLRWWSESTLSTSTFRMLHSLIRPSTMSLSTSRNRYSVRHLASSLVGGRFLCIQLHVKINLEQQPPWLWSHPPQPWLHRRQWAIALLEHFSHNVCAATIVTVGGC
jgi:hypothetical protein